MSKKLNILFPAIAFIMLFIVVYQQPIMISDDFYYHQLGLGLNAHIQQYLNWGGRFISDYIVSFILYFQSPFFQAALISLALVLMIFLISLLPSVWHKEKYNPFYFVAILGLYWITAPVLGQQIFWVTGTGNYLFLNLIFVAYLYFLAKYIQQGKNFIALLIFSFLSGLSHETIAPVVLVISFVAAIYSSKKHKNHQVWWSFLLVLFGTIILIASPGNFSRIHNEEEWTNWRNATAMEKITRFFSVLLPKALKVMSPLWLLSILLILLRFIFTDKKDLVLSILFLLAGLGSILVMMFSPQLPERALSASAIFVLISCVISLFHLLQSENKNSHAIVYLMGFILSVAFLYSYYLIFVASHILMQQNHIREISIQKNIDKGYTTFTIPNFYRPPSLRVGDAFLPYHSPYLDIAEEWGKRYGVDKINIRDIYFDYSAIQYGKKIPLENHEVFNAIYVRKNTNRQGSSIVFSLKEINNVQAALNETYVNFDMMVIDKGGRPHNIATETEERNKFYLFSIAGENIIGFMVGLEPQDIRSLVVNGQEIRVSLK
ncbi:MAG: hypothetical protein IKI11_02530 [Neisseriaceae bacterium]|nr:hypothetical protein [Neisseriaceae bacterium]